MPQTISRGLGITMFCFESVNFVGFIAIAAPPPRFAPGLGVTNGFMRLQCYTLLYDTVWYPWLYDTVLFKTDLLSLSFSVGLAM